MLHAGTRPAPRGQSPRGIDRVVLNKTNLFTRTRAGRGARRLSTMVPRSPAVNPRDRQELVRLEARATDQRAVHVGNVHQLLRVRRLYRSTVEDADALPLLSQARFHTLADERMHLCDIARRRREPAADRPDRLA